MNHEKGVLNKPVNNNKTFSHNTEFLRLKTIS